MLLLLDFVDLVILLRAEFRAGGPLPDRPPPLTGEADTLWLPVCAWRLDFLLGVGGA